jgi:hypothetical protein
MKIVNTGSNWYKSGKSSGVQLPMISGISGALPTGPKQPEPVGPQGENMALSFNPLDKNIKPHVAKIPSMVHIE